MLHRVPRPSQEVVSDAVEQFTFHLPKFFTEDISDDE